MGSPAFVFCTYSSTRMGPPRETISFRAEAHATYACVQAHRCARYAIPLSTHSTSSDMSFHLSFHAASTVAKFNHMSVADAQLIKQ